MQMNQTRKGTQQYQTTDIYTVGMGKWVKKKWSLLSVNECADQKKTHPLYIRLILIIDH